MYYCVQTSFEKERDQGLSGQQTNTSTLPAIQQGKVFQSPKMGLRHVQISTGQVFRFRAEPIISSLKRTVTPGELRSL